ncbi:hypothetical protein D9613_003886 [Agrocybe pediades]|uniref:Uncharacterized protein n=1 Tax=Agrocybe pediades TaxID=84607 RepID=A0A8H4QJQ6_9AGAR|nr:hypothetical protein D9613_003886 [Agrocybe pediades]
MTESESTERSPYSQSRRAPRLLNTFMHNHGTETRLPASIVRVPRPPTDVFLSIFQSIACRIWYNANDPTAFPPTAHIPEEYCTTPGVDKYYSVLITIMSTADGIGSILGYALFSYLASRYGRRPVLLGFLMISVISAASFLCAQLFLDWRQLALLLLWIICEIVGNARTVVFATNVCILDTAKAEERTVSLSQVAGWGAFGGTLSTAVGGSITSYAHNTKTVYAVSIACMMFLVLYTFLMVPETFPVEKREQLRLERLENSRSGESNAQNSGSIRSWLSRMRKSVMVAFESFEVLKPTYNPESGSKNWRLIYCAIHIFVVTLADGYVMQAALIYFSTQYMYNPAQNGYVLTLYTLVGTLTYTVGVPFLVGLLKPLYQKKEQKQVEDPEHSDDNNPQNSEASEEEEDEEAPLNPSPEEAVISESSEHLDVHITLASWFIESVAYIVVGLTHTVVHQMIAIGCAGLGAGRVTAFRSLVAASVEPLKQGEALAAIEMISSVGLMLSPLVMGSILTSTIGTVPQTIFYVHAAIIVFGAAVLFLIRDVDRYHTPLSEDNTDR